MPTLKELLEKGESFKYGTDYRNIETNKQSVSDFEQNGVRPNRLNLQANIYGTETLRITKQSTAILDDMRASTGGNQGLLGGLINQGTKIVNNFASKLGFPILQIPTRVSDDGKLRRAIKGIGNDSIPEALAKIKQSGEGNILGKFLPQTAEGTPTTLISVLATLEAGSNGAMGVFAFFQLLKDFSIKGFTWSNFTSPTTTR